MEQSGQKANREQIENALLSIIPDTIFSAFSESANPAALLLEKLLPEELDYLSTLKSEVRSRHFIMGRLAARAALSRISSSVKSPQTQPLLKLDSGLVRWPEGITGSISHSGNIAVAAVALTDNYRSLGIDLEIYREISPAAVERIASDEELKRLKAISFSEEASFFAIFSAKESIFKAIYPMVHKRFGFGAARLTSVRPAQASSLSPSAFHLEFRILQDLSSDFATGCTVLVSLFQSQSFCLTLCTLPVIE